MANRRVHRYNTLRWLGDGRFANVYLAEENFEPYRQVAIKVMKEELTHDERARAAFAREKEILERLQANPSVVKLVGERYSFRGTQQIPYLVLSIPPGKSLIDLIDEQGPFSEQEGLQICLQACDVLCDAHAAGIIHNDIKPEHFFWDGRKVTVIDWNVSRFVSPDPASRQAQSWEGDQGYATVEQPRGGLSTALWKLLGRQNAGQAAPQRSNVPRTVYPPGGPASPAIVDFLGDILEFGTVMYAIFTGWDARDRPGDDPRARDSSRAKIEHTQTVDAKLEDSFRVTAEGITWPVYFGEYGARLSTALQNVICKSLEPDESIRFKTAEEMRNELIRCAPGLDDIYIDDDLVGLDRLEIPSGTAEPTGPRVGFPHEADNVSRKVRAHIAKGQSALRAEDYEDAIAEFRQALALDPYSEVAARFLAQAEELQRQSPRPTTPDIPFQKRVRALISKGKSALNAGDFDDAIALFGQALDLDPDNEQAQRLLTQARIRRKGGDYQRPQATADPRHQYYDSNTKGWLPQGRPVLRFNVPYILEVVQGPQPGIWYPIVPDGHLTLGRSYRNDIVLLDRSVSRFHAVLICHAGYCQIVDSGSTNGTFINGRRVVNRQDIQIGDSLQFGQMVLRLDSTSALSPTRLIHTRR
jgi:serine/threonine protein kinase